jgi:hypothetical protein
MALARGDERNLLRAAGWRGLAAASDRFAASNHGLSMVQCVARYRSVRNHQPLACHGGPGAGWARGIAECCRARQPKREDDGERRVARLRCGEEANDRSWSIRTGAGSFLSRNQRMFRTAMARLSSCGCRGARSHSSPRPSPTWALLASHMRQRPQSPSRSSASPPIRSASRFTRADGSWRGSLPGSAEPAALEGPGGNSRFGPSLPLRCLNHASDPPLGPALMNFGPDSKCNCGGSKPRTPRSLADGPWPNVAADQERASAFPSGN